MKEQLLNWLDNSQLQELISYLRTQVNDAEFRQRITLLSSRWARLIQESDKGTIAKSDYNVEYNRLVDAAQHLVADIPEALLPPLSMPTAETPISTHHSSNKSTTMVIESALLSSVVTLVAKPFLEKAAEGFMSAIGEDVWNKVKSLTNKSALPEAQQQALVQAVEAAELMPSADTLSVLENQLKPVLHHAELAQPFVEVLNLTPAKLFKIQLMTQSIKKISAELPELYEGYENAGIGTQGDYRNRIKTQERKRSELEQDLFKILAV